jgi:hydrogenase maturation factor
VPHYLSRTTLHKDRLFRYLYVISILINFIYFAVRVFYIWSGRVKVTAPSNASMKELKAANAQNGAAMIYSAIVLVAELGGFVLVHVGQQMFTKQKTNFAKMTTDNIAKMAKVRPTLGHAPT